jgi:hypothetical protein
MLGEEFGGARRGILHRFHRLRTLLLAVLLTTLATAMTAVVASADYWPHVGNT